MLTVYFSTSRYTVVHSKFGAAAENSEGGVHLGRARTEEEQPMYPRPFYRIFDCGPIGFAPAAGQPAPPP